MVKKLLSEKEKRMIRMIQALPWVGCWRIAKIKYAVRRRNRQIVQVDEEKAAFDSINLTEPSETLSSAELFEKKLFRRLALKWNDNERKWNSARNLNQPVPASVIAFRSLTSVKMSAENYFSQNPKKQVLVYSAEQLYELDDGSYYDVHYPADLPVEEIGKICDDCEAMLLPCNPYDGELKFSHMVGAPEVPKDGTTSKKRKKNLLEIAASKSVKLQNFEKETLFSVGSSEDQNLLSDLNTLVEPEPHEDLNAAKLSDVELRDKKRIRWRALKWRKTDMNGRLQTV
ncbi:hypothetical protein LOK49_LG08G02675 [Camellia lanceoleosa]|uniref:Uncharacterized protein n=1 Tax=Camellia lanceoleosa TaxID=1840588 RepID=A0ACC0GRH4_9ERIC|nr:hypothetical protein LOK49_LG08G02675 [Camellia lanceoleosa]